MADREQANVLELTRRQSTLNVLSEPFEHARYLRIDMRRNLLWLIKNVLPQDTLMGVNGVMTEGSFINGGYKALKFNKKLVAAFDYDVIVNDTPASVDERTRTYEILKDVIGFTAPLIDQGRLETAKTFVGTSPLPASIIQRLSQSIDNDLQHAQNQAQQQQASQMQTTDAGQRIADKVETDILTLKQKVANSLHNLDEKNAELEKDKSESCGLDGAHLRLLNQSVSDH